MSKVAEYKQINTRTEPYTVNIPAEYDDEGNRISHAEYNPDGSVKGYLDV